MLIRGSFQKPFFNLGTFHELSVLPSITVGYTYLCYIYFLFSKSYEDIDSDSERSETTLSVICPEFSMLLVGSGNQKYIFLSTRWDESTLYQ